MAIHRRLPEHCFLAILGVRPEYRRSGIGGELLEAGVGRCAQTGLATVLDTSVPENVEWYARHGFSTRAAVKWRFGTTWVMERGGDAKRG